MIKFLLKHGADTSLRKNYRTGLQYLKSGYFDKYNGKPRTGNIDMYNRILEFISENNIKVNKEDL